MQVRGPLSALRTLGAILQPRTQDVNRDVADGIVTQVGGPATRTLVFSHSSLIS
jgi:hypothetical protein